MNLPTPYIVGIRSHSSGTTDAHGNLVDGWAIATEVGVYGIAPTTSTEPTAGRSEVITGYTILAPPGTHVGPHDRVVIDGVEFEVDGEIGDYTRGPFRFSSGVSINVKRAEG